MNLKRCLNKLLLLLFCLSLNQVSAQYTVNYNAINGIASNAVRKVFIDHSNRVWLGTGNGLSLLTSNGIQNIIYPAEWKNNQVWEIMETPDSCLWIGTFKGDLYLFKNGEFSSVELPKTQHNRPLRRLYLYDEQVFVGTDQGLFVVDYQTKQILPYRSVDGLINIQVMSFFIIRDQLYFVSFQHGIFSLDTKKHHYEKINYAYLEESAVFYAQALGDSLIISRGKNNQPVPYNLLSLSFDGLLNLQAPDDSLVMNSLAWKVEPTNTGDLYAACWGVNDITGGLYRKQGPVMQKINQEFHIESNRIWDIKYHADNNKLYVASLDKGLYIVDLNNIIAKDALLADINMLDAKILGGELYLLSDQEVIKFDGEGISKKITYQEIDHFLKHHQASIDYTGGKVNIPLTLREIIDLRDQVGITSNYGLILFDRDLQALDYFAGNGQIRATLLSNNDLIITTDYAEARVLENRGQGRHIVFSAYEASNPTHVLQVCRLNDSLHLFNTSNFKLYLYNQNSMQFSQLDNPQEIKFPCTIEAQSQDTVLILDKANDLYLGIYSQERLEVQRTALSLSPAVSECYFLKYQAGWTCIGSNQGLHLIRNDTAYLINRCLGLPGDALPQTVQIWNDTLMLATSKGVYSIDLNKLKSLEFNTQVNNLQLTYGETIHILRPGQSLGFRSKPKELLLTWEVNAHPYPRNLSYRYRINADSTWHHVERPGKITWLNAEYGQNTIYLEINDATLGSREVIKLLEAEFILAFYKSSAFLFLLLILLTATGIYLSFKTKLSLLRQKEQKAQRESSQIKQKLELLHFLLKPHFVFNALTSIQNLIIEQKTDKSLTYTNYFSKYLRSILDSSGEDLISLKDEIKNMENYVNLEKLRFNEQIGFKINIDPSLNPEHIYLIPFLFQPILENCFKHAFKGKTKQATIKIDIKNSDKCISYTIADNGIGTQGLSKKDLLEKSTSKGLKIVESQLNKYYPRAYSFELLNPGCQGCCWQICIYKNKRSIAYDTRPARTL